MRDKRSKGQCASADAAFKDITQWMLENKYKANGKNSCWNIWPHQMHNKETRRLNKALGITPYTISEQRIKADKARIKN